MTLRPGWLRYGVVPLALAAAMLLRVLLWPVLEDEMAFLFLWPAVMFCAWYGGLGPGLLATLLAPLSAAFFLLEPRFSFTVAKPADGIGLAVFIAVNVVISFLCDRLQGSRRLAEARTAELALAKSHLEAVLHSVDEGIVAFDARGDLVFCNHTQARITGFGSPQEMMHNLSGFAAAFELTDAGGRSVPLSEWPVSRILRGEVVTGWECHGRRKDSGQEWDFSFSGSPVKAADGRQILAVVVTQDVTARTAAEVALRESEERFRTLANSIPQLAWTARPDGHIFWYNRRWYEYTGTTPEQMEGWGWQSVHDPRELPVVLERWKGSIASGEPFDMVFPLRGKDGRFRPFLTRIVPLRGEDGRILQWFGTNTDISAIKEMEEALRAANRHKDNFLAMLAHELRNPLAPLRTSLQVLKSARADREAVEKAREVMERQVVHMAHIVDDLLDVSRISRGKIELRLERADLGRLVRHVVEDQHAAFEEAGLSIRVDVPEVPTWVQGDPTRLTQVLGNLLHNAVKFTPAGGAVSVRLCPDPARGQAVLTVTDTGVGIEPELLPRLFQPFTQADQSLERSKGGLGLGLSLVKGLVEQHGGTVEAHSPGPGQGAELVIRLPAQPEPAAVTALPSAPSTAPQRLRVLVVEDNRDAADTLRLLLELYGYDVAVAYTGPAGVEKATEWKPDAVLCDIGLPGLDGYGVARQLRRTPATAQARLIAVTGYDGDEDRERSRAAGFDAHLAKPADPAAIQRLLAAP